MDAKLQGYIDKLNALNFKEMYNGDFFLTWEKTDDEIEAVFTVADALRYMRENNISTKVFESGLGISLFRDNSTRTRFSFASACNLLGLEVQDLDEGKSQVAHGETVRETANMISFMADVIGIRDDMYIGKGNKYMHEVVDAVTQGNKDGILEQKPTLVNLQCDIDHPTQAMADMLHIIHEFGGVENLKGKKLAMTWAYSPSYGKPLSVPQGIIGLMTRFGMDVVLAHPEGYEVSYIQRAGLHLQLWKNVQNCMEMVIQKVSKNLRKNFLLRTQSTKIGLVQKSLWLQQKTEKLFTCTACQLISQA